MNLCCFYIRSLFYSHVNYSVTKIASITKKLSFLFYSHVNYSVTKIHPVSTIMYAVFYSHVNYSVTKISDQAQTE